MERDYVPLIDEYGELVADNEAIGAQCGQVEEYEEIGVVVLDPAQLPLREGVLEVQGMEGESLGEEVDVFSA